MFRRAVTTKLLELDLSYLGTPRPLLNIKFIFRLVAIYYEVSANSSHINNCIASQLCFRLQTLMTLGNVILENQIYLNGAETVILQGLGFNFATLKHSQILG